MSDLEPLTEADWDALAEQAMAERGYSTMTRAERSERAYRLSACDAAGD